MIYDVMINAYNRQAELLEKRLQELKADRCLKHDDTYSSRVALLKHEISDLRIHAKHLMDRQGGGP